MVDAINNDVNFNWFHSGQLGALQMSGASNSEGQLLGVLDSVLIDGFNSQTVSSAAVIGNTVTLNYATDHGYVEKQKITISGAADIKLNGSHRVVSVTATQVVVTVDGVSGTAGTITTKVSPLGWESIFGKTNPMKRAYRSLALDSTKTVLFLDMTLPTGHGYHGTNPAKRAMITLCQDMTAIGQPINDYTLSLNNKPQAVNGSLFWYQKRGYGKTESVTSSKNNSWFIYGNSKFFVFLNGYSTNAGLDGTIARSSYAFGDFISAGGDNDRYNCMLVCANSPDDIAGDYSTNTATSTSSYSTATYAPFGNQPYYNNTVIIIKKVDGTGQEQQAIWTIYNEASTSSSGKRDTGLGQIPYPNPVDNALIVKPLELIQINNVYRGIVPRLHFICNNMPLSFPDLQIIGDYIVVAIQKNSSPSPVFGYFAIDLRD